MIKFFDENPFLLGVILEMIGVLGVFLMNFKRKEDEGIFSKSYTFKGYFISIIFIIFGILYMLGWLGNNIPN